MPVLCHPRSRRLFEATPQTECIIPTTDGQAYDMFPEFRWVYNKLTIAELGSIACGPHNTCPPRHLYPIFSKPIYNLGGMGADARRIATSQDYWRSVTPGHMWSAYLQGEHYSTDIAVVQGRPVWLSHTRGAPGPEQTWDYWEINMPGSLSLQYAITNFVETHLATYTGMLNMETIDDKIIEVHLRLSPQWPDLYGNSFLSSLVSLYCTGEWLDACRDLQIGYSVVLFDEEKYARLSTIVTDACLGEMGRRCGVCSITMRYDAEKPIESIMRPLGGYRIAWINGFDLDKCQRAREMLRDYLHKLYESGDHSMYGHGMNGYIEEY
ncbi:hypothetical protein NUU61_004463 [Penicillium alfredii]|uniref:Uncharacterized protein n=1 Tax=Penicillium alfredii TaxID=1506179 RepID=A0A9W9KDW0_9EURO|nr:uncharacterized protein NUU61_004463 [Penicillium alfredii]KAJ5102241.1 hypothetical protein NUU61_004463 [Penicillium alfredii]